MALWERILDATPVDNPGRGRVLSNLGAALRTRFARTGDPADLDAAVQAGYDAVAGSPPGSPDRARCLSNLGGALQTRFAWAGNPADLDAAVRAGNDAVQATLPDHPDLGAMLSNLAGALCSKPRLSTGTTRLSSRCSRT